MSRELFISKEETGVANARQLARFLDELPTGKWLLKAERKDRRTSPQNRYMHMMFNLIQKGFYDIGYREVKSMDDAKYIMKEMFLSYHIDNGTGGRVKMVRRTRDLNKEQMAVFIDECIQFAAENLGVVIPNPGEQTEMFAA